ncbi:MAG: phosphatase PAP2 family protein [Gemmatimonadota bacterium]|nr:phosphatase PAP2 family protein [Gemmatimonadota bacterium]
MPATAFSKPTEKIPPQQLARLIGTPVLSLLIIVTVAWLVRPLVTGALASSAVSNSDVTLLHWFRSHATTLVDGVFVFIALLGAPGTLAVIAVIGAVVLYRRRLWTVLTVWLEAFAGSSLLSVGIKHIYARPRPAGATEFLHGTSFSFPSTHALTSMVAFSTIAYTLGILHEDSSRWKRTIAIGAPLLIAAIGLSRLYLGVHYLSDVVAGFVIGVVWATVCIVTLHRYK